MGSDVSVKYRDDAGVASRVRGRLTDVSDVTDADESAGGGTITIVDEHEKRARHPARDAEW